MHEKYIKINYFKTSEAYQKRGHTFAPTFMYYGSIGKKYWKSIVWECRHSESEKTAGSGNTLSISTESKSKFHVKFVFT